MNTFGLALVALSIAYPGLLVAAAVRRTGSLAAKSRADLITTGLDAVLAVTIAHRLIDWSALPTWTWLIPVALLAVGVAAAIVTWTRLPRLREGRPVRRSMIGAGLHAAASLALLIIVLLL